MGGKSSKKEQALAIILMGTLYMQTFDSFAGKPPLVSQALLRTEIQEPGS